MTHEVTKHLISTPYGVLTMDMSTYSRFSSVSEELQWSHLSRTIKNGDHKKAKAMQWFWERLAERANKRLN